MKHYFFLVALLFICHTAYSQDLSFMQGIRQKDGSVLLEVSGYDIVLTTFKGNINNEKTLSSIKKKFEFQTILAEYSEQKLSVTNKIIELERVDKDRPYAKFNQICYLFQASEKEVTVLFFSTLNQRDTVLEQKIVEQYLLNKLSDYITEYSRPSFFLFAGREISMNYKCEWRSPHNIHCSGGQVSWSEFTTLESAEFDIENRIQANLSDKFPVLMEEDIDIVFENIPTTAYRVVYQTMQNDPLIVYYVVEEVRGRFISCTLSNYGYNRYDYNLPRLLERIMYIPELPEHAYESYKEERYDEIVQEEKKEKDKDYISMWEVYIGTRQPIGNLKKRFKTAPALGFHAGYAFNKSMALDLGMEIAVPVYPKKYNFYYDDEVYTTRSNFMVGINVRFRYQKKVAENVYFTPYAGVGFHSLQTDLEKEFYEDGENKYHSIETVDVFGGVNLRYKIVGCFIEYHYTPYSIANKVSGSFGNSSLNIGLNVSF